IDVAIVVEHRAVDANQIHAAPGQHPRDAAQLRGSIDTMRRTVHRPEADWFACLAEDKLAAFRGDESVLAGKLLVERTQIKQRDRIKPVAGRREIEPTLVRSGGEPAGQDPSEGNERDNNASRIHDRTLPF